MNVMQKQQYDELKERVYYLMNGFYNLSEHTIPGSEIVSNEFADGQPCAELYQKAYDANRRICERLGVDEDSDVEELVNTLLDIAKILAKKMFDYGTKLEDLKA
jgi:hypothetical protein